MKRLGYTARARNAKYTEDGLEPGGDRRGLGGGEKGLECKPEVHRSQGEGSEEDRGSERRRRRRRKVLLLLLVIQS